ncbi:MAG: signal peptidase II [Gammaproteobacteria bacterium RIFCSPHIGHO2_12_FULL_37_34]|nr:MAG: signal peptidase II [Gammaproteobacteria bacterium RIFCSPHIGHO2_12_FULL_37_34]
MLKKIFSSGFAWLWLAIVILALDRFAKIWVIDHLIMGEPFSILPIFNLTVAFNTGAAFSFLNSASGWQNIFLGSLAVVVSVVILVWLWRLSVRDYWLCISLNLILGGALGNVWDRVLYGYVVDFFDFHLGDWHFAIFNMADSAITIGAGMMLLHWLVYPKK